MYHNKIFTQAYNQLPANKHNYLTSSINCYNRVNNSDNDAINLEKLKSYNFNSFKFGFYCIEMLFCDDLGGRTLDDYLYFGFDMESLKIVALEYSKELS